MWPWVIAAGFWTALAPLAAHATEDGASSYPQGPDFHLSGVLPPPGDYGGSTFNVYYADRFNDSAGDKASPADFEFLALADILGYVHVTDVTFLGGQWAQRVFAPLVYLQARAGGDTRTNAGLGNVSLGPLTLGWHAGNWHWLASPNVLAPVPGWRAGGLNVGQGYWSFSPMAAVTYWDPDWAHASLKLMYDFNLENTASDYHSGDEFHFDFEAGRQLGPLSLGVSGYYHHQTTDDFLRGVRVGDGNRGRAFAAGPTLRYEFSTLELEGAWQHEFIAENRPQGEKLWLRVHFAF